MSSSTSSISFTPRIFRCGTQQTNSPKLDISPIQPDSKLLNTTFSELNTNGYLKSEKTYGLVRPL